MNETKVYRLFTSRWRAHNLPEETRWKAWKKYRKELTWEKTWCKYPPQWKWSIEKFLSR